MPRHAVKEHLMVARCCNAGARLIARATGEMKIVYRNLRIVTELGEETYANRPRVEGMIFPCSDGDSRRPCACPDLFCGNHGLLTLGAIGLVRRANASPDQVSSIAQILKSTHPAASPNSRTAGWVTSVFTPEACFGHAIHSLPPSFSERSARGNCS